MKHSELIHNRQSTRLKGFDYSQEGAYFITICSDNRKCLFGEINNKQMILNQAGMIVQNEWIKSSFIRKEIKLDEFIIMPNHLHSIVFIQHKNSQIDKKLQLPSPVRLKNRSIGSLIAGFKSISTKKINEIRRVTGASIWQRNFYDHIIRNEKSLSYIREYIRNNPENWEKDALFQPVEWS